MSGVIEIADETVEGGDPPLSWFAPNFFRLSPVFSHCESAPGARARPTPGRLADSPVGKRRLVPIFLLIQGKNNTFCSIDRKPFNDKLS